MASRRIGLLTRMRLYLAGWRPHRDVWGQFPLPRYPSVFPEAERILRSFGGLQFGDRNEHVRIDPVAAIEHDEDLAGRCEAAVGRRLYPVGYQEHQDREAVFVDEAGCVYINFGDELCLLAETFEAALAYLVRPGQARTSGPPQHVPGCKATRWPVGDGPQS